MASSNILTAATAASSGHPQVTNGTSPLSFQATITGTGALTGTVVIEGTNEVALSTSNYLTIGTITLSGTTTASDGFVAAAVPWNVVRARIPAGGITGTSATINVYMGYK